MDASRAETFKRDLSTFFGGTPEGHMQPEACGQVFTILAVCKGNVCRSPLMEALLRRHLHGLFQPDGEVCVSSRGVHAVVGAPADPPVRQIARELGLDLDAHRARQFEAPDAEAADLVLTATRHEREHVIGLAPAAAKRCFTLMEFAAVLGKVAVPAPETRATSAAGWEKEIVEHANTARQILNSEAMLDIEDPFGKDHATHQRVSETIASACIAIARRAR